MMICLMSTIGNPVGDIQNLGRREKIMKFTKRKLNNLSVIKII
jgi:hypothetical protein